MKSELLKVGTKYTHISPNPKATVYGQWVVCEVIDNETLAMGYYSEEKGMYIMHNENGPCFRWRGLDNLYYLDGVATTEEEIKKIVRMKKLNRII